MLIEATVAAGLLLMTVLSGSIYPALVAHCLNNVPATVLHLQRIRSDED